MSEIRAILDYWKKDTTASYALATVVHIDGSSYRKPGAHMLIDEKGQSVGAISGGCLEDDVRRQAIRVMSTGQARLLAYETTDEAEDGSKKIKLGCNGKIYILVQAVSANADTHVLRDFDQILSAGQTAVHLTRLQLGASTKVLSIDRRIIALPFAGSFDVMPTELIQQVINKERSAFQRLDADMAFFCDYVQSPISLHILGAGYDVLPLVQMANVLGWPCDIISRRAKTLQGIPPNIRRVIGSNPEDILHQLQITERSAFVLMSHNYEFDKLFMEALLEYDLPYVGMLGPQSKWMKMKNEWAASEKTFGEERINIVHTPIGLDLGARRAEEIAVAICGQVLNIFNR